jgi:hypothetical protein
MASGNSNYFEESTLLNNPESYAIPEIRTANSMPNIPSCAILITSKSEDVIPMQLA